MELNNHLKIQSRYQKRIKIECSEKKNRKIVHIICVICGVNKRDSSYFLHKLNIHNTLNLLLHPVYTQVN